MPLDQRFTARPATVDHEARTVEAIVATGAPVRRAGALERLDMAGADLSRIVGGPVLDGHNAGGTRDQLGVIEAAEVRAEGVWVRIRFRKTAAADAVFESIADGTLRGLSIGYTVSEWRQERVGGRTVRVAVKWTLLEASVVPLAVDPNAQFRSEHRSSIPMDDQTEHAPVEGAETAPAPASSSAMPAPAEAGEDARAIRSLASLAGLGPDWADRMIAGGTSPEAARAAAFEALRTRSEAAPRTASARIVADHDDPETRARRIGGALHARAHGEAPAPESVEFADMTMLDIARDCCRRGGLPTRGSPDQVLTRALHSTSDFPLILGDPVARGVRRGYEAAPAALLPASRRRTARDFRTQHRIALSSGPSLEEVLEGGEITRGTITEAEETYRLATFARVFAISRQAIVNDDLGALTDLQARMGRAAQELVASKLTGLVADNPTMSDGLPVFHADHGNLVGTGAAPSVAEISGMFQMTRRQKGLAGEPINVTPRYLIVPPELEGIARQIAAQINPTTVSDVNPWRLDVLVEARLTDPAAWYLAADPAVAEGLEHAFLSGAEGPVVDSRAGFDVDGVEIRVRLDFGAGWIDHRGWVRNPGA